MSVNKSAFEIAGFEFKPKPFIFDATHRNYSVITANNKCYSKEELTEIFRLICEYLGDINININNTISSKHSYTSSMFEYVKSQIYDYQINKIKDIQLVKISPYVETSRYFIVGNNKNIEIKLSNNYWLFDGQYDIKPVYNQPLLRLYLNDVYGIIQKSWYSPVVYTYYKKTLIKQNNNELCYSMLLCDDNFIESGKFEIYFIYVNTNFLVHRDTKDSNGHTLPAIICYGCCYDNEKISKIQPHLTLLSKLTYDLDDFIINEIESDARIKIWYQNGLVHREDFSIKTGKLLPAIKDTKKISNKYFYRGQKIIGLNTAYGMKYRSK